jgi:hypothetical protein
MAIGAVAPSIINKISSWWNGPQQPTVDQVAQQGYLQQIQQPINIPYAQQHQQLMNQFNQQIVPGLAERFSGAGGQRSSAFGQQLGSAGADLATALGALQEQNQLREAELNQGRLGQLGGYLTGQQQLGLGAQRLAQEGTIASRENALRAMGLMGQQNIAQQRIDLDRLLGRGDLAGKLAGLGLGGQFDTIRHGGAGSLFGQAAQAGLNAGFNYFSGR